MKNILFVTMLGTTLSQSLPCLSHPSDQDQFDQGDLHMDCQVLRNGTEIYDEFSLISLNSDKNTGHLSLQTEYYETVTKESNCSLKDNKIQCTWNKWLGFGFYRYQLDIDLTAAYQYPGADADNYAYSHMGQIEAWLIRPAPVICHVRK